VSLPAYDWIAHHARNSPGAIAAHDLGEARKLTYLQLDARVARLASWLRSQGVARGDRAAILARCRSCGSLWAMLRPRS